MKAGGRVLALVGAGLVLALGAPTASALDVLIADDYFQGDLDHLVTDLASHNVTHLNNTDSGNNPVYTDDRDYLGDFDVVIFYASGDDDLGREITAGEQTALQAYIQGGGNLIVSGYDILGDPDDPLLADVVRSSDYGDDADSDQWVAVSTDHFILNGPFGDFRGQTIDTVGGDCDNLVADTSRGATVIGSLVGDPYDKIVFTDVSAPGGSVGMWNGNDFGNDWKAAMVGGDDGLAILRNWLAGLADADGDGVFDTDDDCPGTPGCASVDSDGCPLDDDDDGVADGCSGTDDDGDGVSDDQDDCPDTPAGAAVDASGCPTGPTGCCGASGPMAPLGLAVGMLLLSRFTRYRSMRRR